MIGGTESLPSGVLLIFVTLLGLIFGSFVTALSYRMPRGISIVKGRSACPSCGSVLTVRDLVPVLSWLAYRGACRACGTKVSWRYPAIEILMAALFAAAALLLGETIQLGIVLCATPIMVALAVIDLEHHRLPNALNASLAIVAFAFRAVHDGDFIVALASAAIVFAFAVILDRITRNLLRQGLGMGDAKLMAIVALALPPAPLLLVLGGAGALGVIFGLVLRRAPTAEPTQFPFGPPILLAFWIALVVL